MGALLEFEAHRAVDGYRILRFDQRKFLELQEEDDLSVIPPPTATDDERHLLKLLGVTALPYGETPSVAHFLSAQSTKIERFNLFESTSALFLEFAHTPTSHQGVLTFANAHGLLGSAGKVERVDDWYWRIRKMRRAIQAWEEAKKNGSVKRVALLTNRHGGTRAFGGAGRMIQCDFGLKIEPSAGAAKICIRPRSLSEALWVQLALAVDGSHNFHSCCECGAWFRLAAGGARSDKRHCSNACRMRMYRNRKEGR